VTPDDFDVEIIYEDLHMECSECRRNFWLGAMIIAVPYKERNLGDMLRIAQEHIYKYHRPDTTDKQEEA